MIDGSKVVPRKSQSGFSFLEILASIVIFSFGAISLAVGYIRLGSNITENQNYSQATALALSFRSILSSSPSLIPSAVNFNSSTYAPGSANLLTQWVSGMQSKLPNATATSTALDSSGNACIDSPCLVTLTISWVKNVQSQQVYFMQVWN